MLLGYQIAIVKTSRNNLTKSVSHAEIVTFAVYLLGGVSKFVDTEDVAVQAHEIAPNRFGWRKYPQHPNLELVRVSLSDAKKSEKGTHLMGSGRRGWSLTAKGREWVEANLDLLERDMSLGDSVSRAGSIDVVRLNREAKRLRSTDAWHQWNAGKRGITAAQAREVFRIDSYTKREMLTLKVDRLLRLFGEDSVLSQFLNDLLELVQEDSEQ
jgi:hypothetical protein